MKPIRLIVLLLITVIIAVPVVFWGVSSDKDYKTKALLRKASAYNKEEKIDEIIHLLEPYADTLGDRVVSPTKGTIPVCITERLGFAYLKKKDDEHALPYLERAMLVLTGSEIRYDGKVLYYESGLSFIVSACRIRLITAGKKLDNLCILNHNKRIKCITIDNKQYISLREIAALIAHVNLSGDRPYILTRSGEKLIISCADGPLPKGTIRGYMQGTTLYVPASVITMLPGGRVESNEKAQMLWLYID